MFYKGEWVGAVGVSGGDEGEDTYLGEVAAEAFLKAVEEDV